MPLMPVVNDLDLSDELGETGLQSYGGTIADEWHPRLKGARGARTFREIRDNDPVVGAILHAMESLIVATRWFVVPRRDPASPSQQAAADFVRDALEGMEHSVEDMLWEALSELTYGWAFHEIVYKRNRDGSIGWRKIALRGQTSLERWSLSPDGTIHGMHQRLTQAGGGSAFIPATRAVHFRTRKDRNNPEGRSLLRNAYRPWFFRTKLEEIEAIGHERNLAGLPVAEVPPEMLAASATPAQRATVAALKLLTQQVRRDEREGMVIPSEFNAEGKPTGFRFRLLASGGRQVTDIGPAIERYDSRIALSLLGQFLLLGQATQVGSYALAESGTNLFVVSLGAIMDGIASTFTQDAVESLCAINGFPPSDYPRWTHGDVDQQDLVKFGAFVSSMLSAGLLTPDERLEAKVREVGGLPPFVKPPGTEATPARVEPPATVEQPVSVDPGVPAPSVSDTVDPSLVSDEVVATAAVQAVALNGAQVDAALGILAQVAAGQLPRDSGVKALITFFGIDEPVAEAIMGAIGRGFVPAPIVTRRKGEEPRDYALRAFVEFGFSEDRAAQIVEELERYR